MKFARLIAAGSVAGALTGFVGAAPVAAATPALGAAAAAPAVAPGLLVGTGAKADDGAYVVSEAFVDARTLDLTIYSPALKTNVMTRLLLPPDWAAKPTATWPTLWMLHGAGEPQDYKSWTAFTDLEAFTADKNALIVLPSDGPAGFYTDWLFGGSTAPRKWATFHMVELFQLLERGYRAGPNRAIAGLSLGGYGALAYSYQYPGRFKAAASYSGIVDTIYPGTPVLVNLLVARAGLDPLRMWGDPVLNVLGWASRNPATNYQKLRGVKLYLSCGNGTPSDGDAPIDARLLESVTAPGNKALAASLTRAGIPVTTDLDNPGVHSWPYWQAQLRKSWPILAAGLGLPG